MASAVVLNFTARQKPCPPFRPFFLRLAFEPEKIFYLGR